jgi:hypothetical protein
MLLVAIVFLYYFINPSEVDFLPKCIFYTTTGIYCPGCGSQRATHHLLNFNILGLLQQNIFYFIVLLMVVYHLVITSINIFFKKHLYNYLYHPKTPIIFLIFLILFWIFRNIPYFPFNLLAPS